MLKDDIRADFNEARKQGDLIKKAALESVIAGILQKQKTCVGKEVSDGEVIECITKEIKVQREIQELYSVREGNESQEAKEKADCLAVYLPKQMTKEEVFGLIKELDVYEDKSPKTKGMIIKSLMPLIAGKFDKGLVNKMVEEYLLNK